MNSMQPHVCLLTFISSMNHSVTDNIVDIVDQ